MELLFERNDKRINERFCNGILSDKKIMVIYRGEFLNPLFGEDVSIQPKKEKVGGVRSICVR